MPHRLLFTVLALSACSRSERPDEPAPPAPAPTPAPAARTHAPPEPPDVKITLSPPSPAPSAPAPATRCTLGGDPLIVPCVGGGSLATTRAGAVYVTDEKGVHRYHRDAGGGGCTLAVDRSFGTAGVLAPPDKQPKPQALGNGPTYMRSGGPAWTVTTAGDAAYLHDFLLGLYRIDSGKLKPVCPDLQGVGSLAIQGDTATISRERGQRVALRKQCAVTPHELTPRASFGVLGVGADPWGKIASGKLARYDASGKQTARIGGDDAFAPGGLCSIAAVSACGDDVCVLDTNCQKLSRFAADGTHRVERAAGALLPHRPDGFAGLAPAGDDLYLLTTEKDGDTCEAALYLIPAAAIAP